MGICAVMTLCYTVGLFLTRKQKEEFGRERLLIRLLHLERWMMGKDRQRILLQELHPAAKEEDMLHQFWYRKLRRVGIIVGVILLLGTCSEVSRLLKHASLFEGAFVQRPEYGEGTGTVSLEVTSDIIGRQTIPLDIEEKQYGEDERKEAFMAAKAYVDSVYLGQNKSRTLVSQPLFLPKTIPNTSIRVRWVPDEDGIILQDGSINWEEIKKETKQVVIRAVFEYQEWQEENVYSVMVVPAAKTAEQQFWEDWQQRLSELDEETGQEKYLSLPQEAAGARVFYEEEDSSKSWGFLILAVLGGFLAMLQFDERLKEDVKRREEQLLLDYPCFVNKFVLLLGAGMTVGGAFEKISREYSQVRQRKGAVVKYAYEEMLVTQQEIINGISEVKAYERYGARVRKLEYLKFSTLISQNLRKGSDRILELLELESVEAFEKRKEYAKKQGEQAGTKLLLPMMLMLLLVMGIIMIPAFLSF